MRSYIASAAFVAGAAATYGNNGTVPVYTTEVVTALVTYCPSSMQIVHGTETYTVTEVSWLNPRDALSGD